MLHAHGVAGGWWPCPMALLSSFRPRLTDVSLENCQLWWLPWLTSRTTCWNERCPEFVSILFCVCLWGSFQKKLTFELVDWRKLFTMWVRGIINLLKTSKTEWNKVLLHLSRWQIRDISVILSSAPAQTKPCHLSFPGYCVFRLSPELCFQLLWVFSLPTAALPSLQPP